MFNWVHSKFHYNPLKDGNSWRKNRECMRKEAKTQGLSKQGDRDHDWRINNGRRPLTISLMGSFHRSSKPINYKPQYFNLKEELLSNKYEIIDHNIVDDDHDDGDDMISPLMATTFLNNFDHNALFSTQFEKSQVVVAIQRHVAQRLCRRVTLADLLMADADASNLKPPVEKVTAPDLPEKLPEVKTGGGSCFAKKVSLAAAEPPARNLRRVMGKMTKRKVHAEVEITSSCLVKKY